MDNNLRQDLDDDDFAEEMSARFAAASFSRAEHEDYTSRASQRLMASDGRV